MNEKKSIVSGHIKRALLAMVDPIVSLIFALIVGSIFIYCLGSDVGVAYKALYTGAFGTKAAMAQTLVYATPLIFTAFAFSIANRAGVFNLGGEGQLYAGAILGAWAGYAIEGIPSWLHILIVILAGALGGMVFGAIPALLKASRGVNEVITCIMLNYIAINVTSFLVNSDDLLKGGSTLPATPMIQPSAQLPYILSGTRLTGAIFIALFFAVVLYIYMWKTRFGYKARAVGLNNNAALYAGIPAVRYSIITMCIAGALAGIGGAVEIISVHGRFYANFSSGYGFEGVAVGMLGSNHPVGIVLAGLLYGALKNGALAMQIQAGTNAEIVKVLQALVVFFIACRWSITAVVQRQYRKKSEAVARANANKA